MSEEPGQEFAAALGEVRELVLDPEGLVRAVAGGHRRGAPRPPWRRVELRWVDLRGGRRLQVVALDERQAHTRNHDPGQAPQVLDELLTHAYAHWHVATVAGTVQMRVTKKGRMLVHREARDAPAPPVHEHDRAKPRLLDPADPVLRAVGISDAQGRLIARRRDKYRQVEELLRAMGPGLDHARPATDRPMRVVDLGCGNAYLTFGAYRLLLDRGVDAELVGVDAKDQARRRNAALAAELGWSDRVRFVEGTILGARIDPPPDLVLALHACDTATDDALARAVRWQAPVVLAAPCCHHDLQRQLGHGGGAPAPYALVCRHAILRERFADLLTDGLRAALLRLLGYRVEVVEFVGSAHTPRNVLLRAVRTGAPPTPDQRAEYAALTASWGVRPALHRLLAEEVDAALAGHRPTGREEPDDRTIHGAAANP